MMRRGMSMAVIAGCLGLVQAARAQYPPPPQVPPSPVGQPVFRPYATLNAGVPEPVPVAGCTAPNQADAPAAAPEATTLPNGPAFADPVTLPDGPGAFPTKSCEPEQACYFHLGYQGLMRQRVSGDFTIAVQDPQNLDTGNPPPADAPVLQRLADLGSPFQSGVRATLGYVMGDNGTVEVSSFYVVQGKSAIAVADPGRIDSPFFNPPLGFEGDNGLWLQADRQSTTFTSSLLEAEVNYRYSDPGITGADLIAGVRFTDLEEGLSTYTDDDGIQFPMTNGQPDPARVATYSVRTHNRLVGPQLGFEWDKACSQYFTVGFTAKGSLGVNFVDLNRQLVRGDGYIGFDASNNSVQFAQTYELNAFIDIQPLERLKIHIGYGAFWLVDIATTAGEYDFNLQNTSTVNNRTGSVFFHGPMAEIQFLF